MPIRVVLDSLDPLFTHEGRFCIIREWKDPHLGYGNSSVVRYFIGRESAVLDRFYATAPEEIAAKYASKEQNFLTKEVDEATFWPESWCVPFPIVTLPRNRLVRFFSTPKKPEDAKILVFYGAISPESAMRGQHERRKRSDKRSGAKIIQRRFKPARWIGAYWNDV